MPPRAPRANRQIPSSLIWTCPRPHVRGSAAARYTGRPRSEDAARARPDATPAPTDTGTPCRQARRNRGRTRHIRPHQHRIVATIARIGQRPKPIEPVRRAIATDRPLRPPRRLKTARSPDQAPERRHHPRRGDAAAPASPAAGYKHNRQRRRQAACPPTDCRSLATHHLAPNHATTAAPKGTARSSANPVARTTIGGPSRFVPGPGRGPHPRIPTREHSRVRNPAAKPDELRC